MQEYNNQDGSKTRTFADLKKALRFAGQMENLGYKAVFSATYLDVFNQWWYPVRYWKEVQPESTFQDQADDAYADLRRAGSFRNI